MKRWYQEKNAPAVGTYLCSVADIPLNGVMEFNFGQQKKNLFRMFVYTEST